MKLTKEKRSSVVKASKITDVISQKLKENLQNSGAKVNLETLAKDLAERKEKVVSQEEKDEE